MFAHTANIRSGITQAGVHDSLSPRLEVSAGPLAGQTFRESRDNDEHPTSVAVAVLFDVTGSMHSVPVELQKKLPDLVELLQFKQYVSDPQILFGAIGDATTDRVPLQLGQFESDNRCENAFEFMYLEGGGGGQNTESYELAMYYMARHTALDCMEKRDHKGYLFIIGDEHPYPVVKPREVRAIIGDDLAEPISTEAIVEELQQKYHVYFIIPGGSGYFDSPELEARWRGLLGQNVIKVRDLNTVAEVIALQVGVAEETIKLEEGLQDLTDRGASQSTIDSVSAALTAA